MCIYKINNIKNITGARVTSQIVPEIVSSARNDLCQSYSIIVTDKMKLRTVKRTMIPFIVRGSVPVLTISKFIFLFNEPF